MLVNQNNLLQYNLYAYCWNNPINMFDEVGESPRAFINWSTRMGWLAGVDGVLPVGDFVYSVGIVVLGAPLLIDDSIICSKKKLVDVTVFVDKIDQEIIEESKAQKDEKEAKQRSKYPIARRKYFKTRKEAEEAARRAGRGRKPRHDPHGDAKNPHPHYHPNVSNDQRLTPHQASMHDHYNYPR